MKIHIEGNIASGKTSLINKLKKYFPECNIIYEPIKEWQDIKDEKGINILEYFYQDTKRYAYTFQHITFITRVKKMKDYIPNKLNFIERSIFSDKFVFAKNCFETGLMNKLEYELYLNWFDLLSNLYNTKPDLIIYLRCSPNINYLRKQNRNRKEEDNISLEYLNQLHNKHEEWLLNNNEYPILIIDANKDFIKNEKIMEDIINKIRNKIEK